MPLTDLPMPGISTSTSSSAPPMKSHGARRCHAFIGTWNATNAATTPARDEQHMPRQEVPCAITGVRRGLGHRDRRRVHHDHADREQQERRPRERRVVGEHRARLARQRASDPKTFSMPNGRSAAVVGVVLGMGILAERVARTSARSARRARRNRGTDRGSRKPATAGRRRRVCASAIGARDRGVERRRRARRAPCVPASARSIDRRVAADQQHGAAMRVDGGSQRREVLPLAVAARDQHDRARRCRRARPASRRPSCPWSR